MSILSTLFDRLFQRQIESRVRDALMGHRELRYLNRSYAQEGEDMVLARYFQGKKNGFFVDIGAHHPVRFSNTFRFYLAGWRGVNVDAMPGSMDAFRGLRPEDVNIEAGVGISSEPLRYHIFNEPALNSFEPSHVEKFEALSEYRVERVVEIEMITLAAIFEKYVPLGREVDFLSVDVEGLDLEVLRSNDWTRFRPRVVIFEDSPLPGVAASMGGPTCDFLMGQGYSFLGKGIRSFFYEHND